MLNLYSMGSENDPAMSATPLLNISKMLCLRRLKKARGVPLQHDRRLWLIPDNAFLLSRLLCH